MLLLAVYVISELGRIVPCGVVAVAVFLTLFGASFSKAYLWYEVM